jgi:membrane protease YdiL (CAAX protease family)
MGPRRSALDLVRVLVPLWLFYAALYLLLVQPFFGQSTHGFFVWGKLLFPPLVLGAASYILYTRTESIYVPRLWLPFAQIDWLVVSFAIMCGIWLSFVPVATTLYFHGPPTISPFLYYGQWSIHDPLFWVANLFLLLSNYAEELYFRGLLYPYFRGKKMGVAAASFLTIVIFTIAHFPNTINLFAVLIPLAIVATFLVQAYKTLFYAFVAHTVVNLVIFLRVSTELRHLIYGSDLQYNVEFLLASVATICLFAAVLYKKRTQREN